MFWSQFLLGPIKLPKLCLPSFGSVHCVLSFILVTYALSHFGTSCCLPACVIARPTLCVSPVSYCLPLPLSFLSLLPDHLYPWVKVQVLFPCVTCECLCITACSLTIPCACQIGYLCLPVYHLLSLIKTFELFACLWVCFVGLSALMSQFLIVICY